MLFYGQECAVLSLRCPEPASYYVRIFNEQLRAASNLGCSRKEAKCLFPESSCIFYF
jgi:hypothetical protein